MTGGSTWTSVAAAYAARGAVDAALLASANASGIGVVQVADDGTVVWSDEAYRLHGRPRWRRVRTIDDVLRGMTPEDAALVRSAYWVLTGDPDVEVRYAVRADAGPSRDLVLRAIDDGVAIVHRAGSGIPSRAADPARPRMLVDVRDQTRTGGPLHPPAPAEPVHLVAVPPPVADPTPETPEPELEPDAPAEEPADTSPVEDDAPGRDIASAVLQASPDLVVVVDVVEQRVVTVAGSEADADALVLELVEGPTGDASTRAVHPDDDTRLQAWRQALASLDPDEVRAVEVRFRLPDGWRWRELRASRFASDGPRVREVVVLVRDVHDRVAAGLLLAERERAFREVFDASPVGLAVLDDQGRFSTVNDAFCRLVGRTREDVLATVYEALLHHEDRAAAVLSRARRTTEGGVATATERRLVRSDGTVLWVRMRTSEIEYDHQQRVLVSVEDVTSSKATEDRLRHDALHDQLTGLPNRRLIVDRIDRALMRSRRTGTRLALFFIDLDDLKRINDTHPWQHRAGDVLITSVAVAVRDTLRDTDTLGRLGGDEFIAICEDIGDDAAITDLGDRILAAVRRPLTIGSETMRVGASIGVAVPADDTETAEALLGRADTAMYRAKTSGGSRVVRAETGAALHHHADISAALQRDELRVHYRPVVSLATGAVLGVEATVRWTDPERGAVPEAEVLAAMDSGASVLPVVHWSIARAVADVRTVSPSRAEHLSVWLSVPARAALAAGTRRAVEEALRGAEGSDDASTAPTLVLGLHQRDVVSLLRRHALMRHLQDLVTVGPLGVGVVDFGTDAIPVGALPELQAVSVTLDPHLLRDAWADASTEALVRALVAAAHALGVVTVAAGVESKQHLELARRLGVDAVQGDLVGPLAPLEVYSDLLLRGVTSLPHTAQPGSPFVAMPPAAAAGADADDDERAVVPAPSSTSPAPAAEREPRRSGGDVPAQEADGGTETTVVAERRLLLSDADDIGEALARELGIALPEPPASASASASQHGAPEPASPVTPSTPAPGAFAGFSLPPSPFLMLRPHDDGTAQS